MKARLLRFTGNLRESYWFVPALMALGAMVLAVVMTWIDIALGSQWMERMAWLHAARPAGARSLLSAVVGSMIGVAGTTFSVTIAAVVYASGQYGPRLLSNFMGDRGNQVTLGTFIATFLYSVLVLRTIRSPGEGGTDADAFVPQLALIVAVLLVLGSVAVLIYYIHHVPRQIHINSVIEGIGRRLLREIDNRFPVFVGQPLDDAASDDPRIPAVFRDVHGQRAASTVAVESDEIGYIQVVDEGTLLDAARDNGLVVRMLYQPGDFTRIGSVLVEAWPAERCPQAVVDRLRGAYAMGNRRTPLQDLKFPIDELVEIAARALSPGVNDPFTANSCLDWLAAAFTDLARRDLPSRLRADDDGTLRVLARPMGFAQLVDRAFGSLAQYASADMIAARRFLAAVGD
ncbi:MAG: DUF2254 domain-containing protein, partial [Xanthomonadales bacterium]|nr:DUF2254 domain-containing protein [Xanthomonadales bacterium]